MADGAADLMEEYRHYLQRFDKALGELDLGAFAKHRGRLIKKLRYDEFAPKWQEHRELVRAFAQVMERGDTINDLLVRVLKERCDELLLEFKF